MAIKSYFFLTLLLLLLLLLLLYVQNNNDDKHRKIIRYDVSDHLGFSCHMKARLLL